MQKSSRSIKSLSIISMLTSVFIMSSCFDSNKDHASVSDVEIGKISTSEIDFESSLRGKNIVDSFYDKLVQKNPQLKQLENEIERINNNVKTTSGLADEYIAKSENYYSSAKYMTNNLTDSTLKSKILQLIDKSIEHNKSTNSDLTDIANLLKSNRLSIHNYHTALKITYTLPVIEAYQKSMKPAIDEFKKAKTEQEELIGKIQDSISE